MPDSPTHRDAIIDQFSRQAIPFTRVPGHLDAMELLLEFAGVGPADRVLDVACGPGLVGCAAAARAGSVTGIDITPAMIAEATRRGREEGRNNVEWVLGDVGAGLPFTDGTFSLVITRYSFHHFPVPATVLEEMVRVCAPGGRVMVADVVMPADRADAYDALEKRRDPSHTHALTEAEFDRMFRASGLRDCRRTAYGVELGLEEQLRASFPHPGDAEKLRREVTADIGIDRLGIRARHDDGGRVVYTCPIAVCLGVKP